MKTKLYNCDICGKEFKIHTATSGAATSPPDGGSKLNYGYKRFPVCHDCYKIYFEISFEEIMHNIETDMDKKDAIKEKELEII